jgi:hypothetical protein
MGNFFVDLSGKRIFSSQKMKFLSEFNFGKMKDLAER